MEVGLAGRWQHISIGLVRGALFGNPNERTAVRGWLEDLVVGSIQRAVEPFLEATTVLDELTSIWVLLIEYQSQ
jgi:hypothetical protein